MVCVPIAVRETVIKSQAIGSRARAGWSEERAHERYCQVKETKRGRMGQWKSELVVVPKKPENTPEWIRRREGQAGQRNSWRER